MADSCLSSRVASPSSQSRVTSPLSQTYRKIFRVESESSHENHRVIGLQARVNVVSDKIEYFPYVVVCFALNTKVFTQSCSK